jgi:hypothetical protein
MHRLAATIIALAVFAPAALMLPAAPALSDGTAVSDSAYAATHPDLIFSVADIPALYAKVRDGGIDDQAYQFIRNRVDNVYSGLSPTQLLEDDYGLEQFLNLGVAGYLESPYDTAALNTGRQLTLLLADSFAVDTDPYASSLRLRNLVIGYDLFMSTATVEERTRVVDEVQSYVTFMLTSLDYELWHHRPYVSNKTAMIAAALGMAGVGLHAELGSASATAARAESDNFIQDWMSAQLEVEGCYREGLLYGLWSMRHLVYYFEARRRFDGYDYAQIPAIRNMADWLLYEIDPRGSGRTNNIQDCTDFFRPLARHNTYLDWARWRWGSESAEYLSLHGPGGFGVDMGDNSDKAATAIWGETAMATDPGTTLPASRLWTGRGLYYYRTGWPFLFDSDDVVFSFYSGVFHGGHAQEDQNQFTITGYGEKLVTDHGAGFPAKESEAHNIVLIDGMGQHNAGLSIGTDGRIDNYILGEHMDLVVGDATRAYTTYSPYNENGVPYPGIIWSWGHTGANPVNHALRTVMVMHEAETPPYFVIIDDIEKDGAVHEYEWRLHTAEENAVNADANPVVIAGDQGAMDVYVVNPCFDSLAAGVSYFDNGAEDDNSNVLSLTASAVVNPYFVTVLMPRSAYASAPTMSTTRWGSGTATTIDWSNGYSDLILTAANDCVAGGVPPAAVTTDAKLALARTFGTSVLRYLMVEGTSLWSGGIERVAIYDGPASVVRSANAAWVDRVDADFSIYAPQDIPVYYHVIEIPTVRVGDYLITVAPSAAVPPAGGPLQVRAFPNPFNPEVHISVTVAAAVDAVAEVYDVAGRRVARVWEGRTVAGENRISWAGRDNAGRAVPSGVYFLRVRAGTEERTTKLTILK